MKALSTIDLKKIEEEQLILVIKDNSVIKKHLQKRGLWVIANMEQRIGWTTEKIIIVFRGVDILLLPSTKEYYPAVLVLARNTSANSIRDSKELIMSFLSSLCWSHPGKLNITRWTNSSNMVEFSDYLRLEKSINYSNLLAPHFKPTYLPDPKDKKRKLALAFYREGMSLNNIAYAFLSFYKIINIHKTKPDKQKKWLENQMVLLENNKDLKERINEIKNDIKIEENVFEGLSKYLYKSCRCAVAHANVKDITYNPEDIYDQIRLSKDLPIIKELARIIIEEEFSIKRKNTVSSEHLYNIVGFYPLIPDDVIKKLKIGEDISRRSILFTNNFSLRIHGVNRLLLAFECLQSRVLSALGGTVRLELSDDCRLIKIIVEIDFINNRLIFNPENIQIKDDKSKKAANFIADIIVFKGKLLSNGELEVWNYDNNRWLARIDPYTPINCFYAGDKTLYEEEKKWRNIAKSR